MTGTQERWFFSFSCFFVTRSLNFDVVGVDEVLRQFFLYLFNFMLIFLSDSLIWAMILQFENKLLLSQRESEIFIKIY